MATTIIIISILCYFSILLTIAYFTSRAATANSYFTGNKESPWYVVALGMIGDSLSGVTFISVPGAVLLAHFGYVQLVLGYFFGYLIISKVLLPLYYRLNLLSIYEYLQQRFGHSAQLTGSLFFILSRLVGAAGRLYVAMLVLQVYVFEPFKIPFMLSASIIIVLILLYTYKGGIKTLVWTDMLQSFFLIGGVVLSIMAISNQYNGNLIADVMKSDYSQIFFWDVMPKSFFLKQFLGGVFIAVAMTGLDQNMMQKNLTCKSLGEAQKNIFWFSIVLVIVNVFFVALGAMLYLYAEKAGIALPMNGEKVITDKVFPTLALNNLGIFAAVAFIIGLTAATFSSADSVLATLTTSFYVDVLKLDTNTELSDEQKNKRRTRLHIGFAVLLLFVILLFKLFADGAIIDSILKLAGYTYGPLLALFTIGLFTKVKLKDQLIPLFAIIGPIVTYILDQVILKDAPYKFGNEIIVVNALITASLFFIFCKEKNEPVVSN